MNKLTNYKKILNEFTNKLNEKYIKRNRKLNFSDILYGSCLKTLNHCSFEKVIYILNKNRVKNISSSSFKKKYSMIKDTDLKDVNKNLLNFIYNDKLKTRILSVDGSYLNTLKILEKDGLKNPSESHTNYTNSIISGIYDVEKKIIINYNHSISKNEREAFIQQLEYVNINDILIFDRGYFSNALIDILNSKKINYIFRMKKSSMYVKNLIENKLESCCYDENNIKFKIVNYKINDVNEEYYLFTTLIDKSIEELKDLYKKRWSIETHFKELKYTTSLKEINSKSLNNLIKEIYMHNFVYISYYFFNDCIKDNNKSYELNHKICLEIFINDILLILIYNNKYKQQIIHIINILPKTYKHKNDDRHFKRESKIKVSKWYIRSKNKKGLSL